MNKVQSGQPLRIPAETFNAFLDAAQDFRNRQRSVSSESQPAVRQTGIVKVKNASGEARGRFNVRRLSSDAVWEQRRLTRYRFACRIFPCSQVNEICKTRIHRSEIGTMCN